jgi:hypothetical protein
MKATHDGPHNVLRSITELLTSIAECRVGGATADLPSGCRHAFPRARRCLDRQTNPIILLSTLTTIQPPDAHHNHDPMASKAAHRRVRMRILSLVRLSPYFSRFSSIFYRSSARNMSPCRENPLHSSGPYQMRRISSLVSHPCSRLAARFVPDEIPHL